MEGSVIMNIFKRGYEVEVGDTPRPKPANPKKKVSGLKDLITNNVDVA